MLCGNLLSESGVTVETTEKQNFDQTIKPRTRKIKYIVQKAIKRTNAHRFKSRWAFARFMRKNEHLERGSILIIVTVTHLFKNIFKQWRNRSTHLFGIFENTAQGVSEKSKISSISTNTAGFCVKKPWNPQRIPAALCLKSCLCLRNIRHFLCFQIHLSKTLCIRRLFGA